MWNSRFSFWTNKPQEISLRQPSSSAFKKGRLLPDVHINQYRRERKKIISQRAMRDQVSKRRICSNQRITHHKNKKQSTWWANRNTGMVPIVPRISDPWTHWGTGSPSGWRDSGLGWGLRRGKAVQACHKPKKIPSHHFKHCLGKILQKDNKNTQQNCKRKCATFQTFPQDVKMCATNPLSSLFVFPREV